MHIVKRSVVNVIVVKPIIGFGCHLKVVRTLVLRKKHDNLSLKYIVTS